VVEAELMEVVVIAEVVLVVEAVEVEDHLAEEEDSHKKQK
jgi:hypothetical protein